MEYKRNKRFKKADKIMKAVQRGLREVKESEEGKRKLKTLDELLNEVCTRTFAKPNQGVEVYPILDQRMV